jgi:hypothetical protein
MPDYTGAHGAAGKRQVPLKSDKNSGGYRV